MRLIKSLSFILLTLAGVAASAQTFEVDGINYNVLSEAEGTVEVTSGDYSGDVVIPAEVTYDGSTYSVTAIGERAFYECGDLVSVDMQGVTTIGGEAFRSCSALTSVEMPFVTAIGDLAFSNCRALTSVSMPAATTIGLGAFSYCYELTSVSMPEVTTIGVRAFYYCYDLTSVSMPEVTTIGGEAFRSCSALTSVDMPSVTTIGNKAFIDCSALTSVNIPESCTSIVGNPFQKCQSLEEIVVDENNPNYSSMDGVLYDKDKTTLIGWPTAEGEIDIMPSVTTIGEDTFFACDALTSVSMPSATTIGVEAFRDCSALTSVSMPEVTTISDYAFYSCSALTSVSMPEVTTISDYAFYSCSALTSVSMPEVTTIGDGAFSGSALTSVDMPSVTTIGNSAFYSCSALTSVSMPEATTIGDKAFYHCSALTSVDIPASATKIGDLVFGRCSGLTSVYCHWEDPLECNPGFVYNVYENATLYVPTGTIDAYHNVLPWRWFINIEEGGYSGIADTPGSGLSVKVIDGVITVEGGDGTASAPVVEVYSTGGLCIYRGTDSSIGGLPHGVYVVRVGSTVQKVAL